MGKNTPERCIWGLMWWKVEHEFVISRVAIRTNFVVEQTNGEWIFWRPFKNGRKPEKRFRVIGDNSTIRAAIVGDWLVRMEEPAWAKTLYRPTAWEHLEGDPFEAV